jgi:hypothetical protein
MKARLRSLFIFTSSRGIFLLLVPWSPFWENNTFVARLTVLHDLFLNPFARGMMSGLGALHLLVGAIDSLAFIRVERG